MKTINCLICISLTIGLVLCGCAKKSSDRQSKIPGSIAQIVEKPLKLDKEIVETPPSPLSVNAVIELGFREPVVPEHLSAVVLDKNPFEFTPAIKGKATWLSAARLRFTPEKPLDPGVTFQARLSGRTLFGSNRDVDDFTFSFKTAQQEVTGFTGDFEPDSSGKNAVRFRGSVGFAQKVDVEVIRKDLKCKVKNRKIELSLKPDDKNGLGVAVVSEPLKRGTEGYVLTFTLPEKYTVRKGEWRKEVFLPESNLFKVLAHMDMSEPDAKLRVYGFRCTDPVKTGTDLRGFITINPAIDYTLVVEGKYFKVKGAFVPGENYSIVIRKGFPSALNMALAEEYRTSFTFSNLKPQLEWLSTGTILPSSNEYRFQFKSVNVAKAYITVTEIYGNNIGFFLQNNVLHTSGKGGRSSGYDDEGDYYYGGNNGYNDLERVGTAIYSDSVEIASKVNTWTKTQLDMSSVFIKKRNSVFVVTVSFNRFGLCGTCTNDRDSVAGGSLFFEDEDYYKNPCGQGYYYRSGTKHKLLIASDIACTVKRARDGLHLYAVNAVEAKPAAGVEFGLFTYQNQLIAQTTTDNSGHLLFTGKIDDASYIRGSKEYGLALFKLSEPSWEINNFDVGGASEGEGGLNVFPYTDRGVHRPGDTIHLSCIVRYARENPDPALPVLLTVFNALNQKSYEAKSVCGENGLIHFAIATSSGDPTGDWRAEIAIGGVKIYHTLKVEMIRPNRFKVALQVPDTLAATGAFEGSIEAKYLFGLPAAGCKATVECYLEPRTLQIAALPEFLFSHPLRKYDPRKITLFEDALDNGGKAPLSSKIEGSAEAPELIGAIATATVYEAGGGFTRQSKRLVVVPYTAFVGVKVPFRYGTARIGEKYSLPIVCVDIHGKPISGHKLRVKHFFNRDYWWWDYDDRNSRDFRTIKNTYAIDEQQVISSVDPAGYTLDIEDYGRHFVEVIDETSGHAAGFFFYASDWGYGTDADGKTPDRNFLEIISDRNMYAPGDRMTLTFPSPAAGTAIVSVEVSDRILEQQVVSLAPGHTSVTFPVSDAMVPNCYAVVSLVQPQRGAGNDAPVRIYGIKTIFVEDRQSHLPLSVTAPDELMPNREFTVQVSSAAPIPASYTIVLVDEGLLDLTGFITPDPWKFYYQKIRLGVVTRDNFDEVIGMLLPDMDRTFSIGGSEGIEQRAGATREQRFKPVVLFAGPLMIKPGKTGQHTFTMPNYVGSVRLMVIGCAGKSFSSYEKAIPVRAPLMILPTVPRIARPLDRFSLPVSLFAMDESIREVTLKLQVSKELTVEGPATLPVVFEKTGERDTAFMVSVGAAIGAASIRVTAQAGAHHASDSITLPLTPPNPFYTDVFDTVISGGGAVTLPVEPVGIKGTNKASIAISRIPDMQLSKRISDLIRYPYGCIEQTTSAAFPQIYIGSLFGMTAAQKQETTDNINAAIERLSTFVHASGGFTYWPGSTDYSDWGTTYAVHFLTEARRAGYHVPASLLRSSLKGLQAHAKDVNRANHRTQAYRLLVLALAEKPDQGAMNLMRENWLAEMDPLSRLLLATAYYCAGQKESAKSIAGYAPTEVTTYRETGGSFGSSLRDRALIAWCMIKMDDPGKAGKLIKSICREFRPWGWYSTQETAMALLALSTLYVKSPVTGGDLPFTIKIAGGKTEKMLCKGYQTVVDVGAAFGKSVTVATDHKDPLFCSLLREGIPLHGSIKAGHNNIELARNFYDDNGNPLTIGNIGQGQPFWIRYRVQGSTGENVNNIALSSMIPSGWEIINLRLEGLDYPHWARIRGMTEGTYMDIRDDRINWFFDLEENEYYYFYVKINPSFRGTYRLPPAVAEAMYSPDYYARLPGDTVEVK